MLPIELNNSGYSSSKLTLNVTPAKIQAGMLISINVIKEAHGLGL